MSSLSIRTALQNRLLGMPLAIQTVFEGQEFSPSDGVPYQTVRLIPSAPLNPTFGNDYYREVGTFRVRLFYPSRSGPGAITSQAERIRDWFPRGLSLVSGDITTIIEGTPSISDSRLEDERMVVVVDIKYFASVFLT